MSTVVHAFVEEDADCRGQHLDFWYGSIRPEDEDDDGVVCWCGARNVWLNDSVCAVWHLRNWSDG